MKRAIVITFAVLAAAGTAIGVAARRQQSRRLPDAS